MDTWELIISIVAAIGLFSHSLESFSNNFKEQAQGTLKQVIGRLSNSKIKGLLLGFGATAIIQSSSAVSAILVSLTDAGVIGFNNALPVLLGSNLGTTVTAWLVSFRLEALGIVLLALGFVLGYFKGRINLLAKPIFYLGLILFSLELISQFLGPVKESEALVDFLSYASQPIIGILIGALITALCQSSSVTIGLTIILCGQGVLNLESAIAIIVGSNVGTTTTAFLASINLGKVAKKTAFANLIYNVFGVLFYLPLAGVFEWAVRAITNDLSYQVAFAHLFFNLIIAVLLLPFTSPLARWLDNRPQFKD